MPKADSCTAVPQVGKAKQVFANLFDKARRRQKRSKLNPSDDRSTCFLSPGLLDPLAATVSPFLRLVTASKYVLGVGLSKRLWSFLTRPRLAFSALLN